MYCITHFSSKKWVHIVMLGPKFMWADFVNMLIVTIEHEDHMRVLHKKERFCDWEREYSELTKVRGSQLRVFLPLAVRFYSERRTIRRSFRSLALPRGRRGSNYGALAETDRSHRSLRHWSTSILNAVGKTGSRREYSSKLSFDQKTETNDRLACHLRNRERKKIRLLASVGTLFKQDHSLLIARHG